MTTGRVTVAAVLAAACFCSSGGLFAQVEVVDSNNRLLNQSVQRPATTTGTGANVSAELYYQLQLLQQEVTELRGLVEEQSYQLERLKQQRLDDYVDFDRRLSAMTNGGLPAANGGETGPVGDSDRPAVTQSVEGNAPLQADEVQSYRKAIDLVLRQKDYQNAIAAFQQYLNDFPRGRYAANSQYWLGEIYLLQNDLESAREWFSRLLNEFPNHAKVPDASYKLGTVYHKIGDSAKARDLLQQVARGDTNAARLAASYLAEMGNP